MRRPVTAFAPDNLSPVKQVVLRGGKTQVVDVPAPAPSPGSVLVANAASAISSGTERSVVASGSGSLAARAIRNPHLVAQTLQHAREHGVRETVDAVRGAVAQDSPLGYSCAGHGARHRRHRRRCTSASASPAPARAARTTPSVVSVPANLVVPVPEGVSLRDAAFTTIGAIALQGVRRAEPSLGERVVVVGLGLLGLITVQVLRAAGCRVVGVEPVESAASWREELGAELALAPAEAAEAVAGWTGGAGADAVVITASAKGDELVNDAVRMLRRKGRLVPVGDVGLDFDREALYEREADVLISTSYGPGRYDPSYEEGGLDYPLPYVRWTAGRNMEEFLRLLADGLVTLDPLVELELPVERAARGVRRARRRRPAAGRRAHLRRARRRSPMQRSSAPVERRDGEVRVALVGAGSFMRGTHVPNLEARGGRADRGRRQPRRDLSRVAGPLARRRPPRHRLARGGRGAGRRPRPRRHPPRHPRRDRGRRAAGRQGGLRREAARPHAGGDRRRLGRRSARTTGWRSASTARSPRSRGSSSRRFVLRPGQSSSSTA